MSFWGFCLAAKSWANLSSVLFMAVNCHSLPQTSVLQRGWLGEIVFILYPLQNDFAKQTEGCSDQKVKIVFGRWWVDHLPGVDWVCMGEGLQVKMVS